MSVEKKTYRVAIVLEIEAESQVVANGQVIDWWSEHREGNALEVFPQGYVALSVMTNDYKDCIYTSNPTDNPIDVSDDAELIEDDNDRR